MSMRLALIVCAAITALTLSLSAQSPEGVPPGFRLQILHASDLEGGVEAIGDAPRFAAIVDALENNAATAGLASILLSAGDNYIPGPFFNAAGDPSIQPILQAVLGNPNARVLEGRVDAAIMNILGLDASAVGNHEFDAGTQAFRDIIGVDDRLSSGFQRWRGVNFPYLSANLDFSGDPALAAIATTAILPNTAFQNFTNNGDDRLAPATILMRQGQMIGVVGATTPVVATISSTGGVQVRNPGAGTNDMVALAAVIQPTIDALLALGVNKIVLVSHLQQIGLEQQLIPLLRGVDISIAGGSDTLLADNTDRLRTGDVAAGTYPLMTTGADGQPALIVSTDGQYSYVGRLVVSFDANGVIDVGSINPNESGAYATDLQGAADLYGGSDPIALGLSAKGSSVAQLTGAVQAVVTARDGLVYGSSSVFLEGRRNLVRTEETNLGNLTADANLWRVQQIDADVLVSHKNGGGIRAQIGSIDGLTGVTGPTEANPLSGKLAGQISQLDIENSLRFNNLLSMLTVTRAQMKAVLEHSVAASNPGATPGQFGQWGGVSFSFDRTLPAGQRVRNAVLTADGVAVPVLVLDGAVIDGPPIRLVTLNFLASGGDAYPFPSFVAANPSFANRVDTSIGEQAALADFLSAFHATTPYAEADTPVAQDTRIQNLAFRSDGVLGQLGLRISVHQDTANCGPVQVLVVNATPGATLLNLASTTCTNGDGPFFGIGLDALAQVTLPFGTAPFHVAADVEGRYAFQATSLCLMPTTLEAISIEIIGLQVGQISPPTPCVNVNL